MIFKCFLFFRRRAFVVTGGRRQTNITMSAAHGNGTLEEIVRIRAQYLPQRHGGQFSRHHTPMFAIFTTDINGYRNG